MKRSTVHVVSSCARQRETLAIMLDADFEVVLSDSLEAPLAPPLPAVVVVSLEAAAAWPEDEIARASDHWGSTAMVLVDPPPPVRARFPRALLASWSDPLFLPAIVAAAAERPRRGASPAMTRALTSADLALRPRFESALVMAELVEVARRGESIALAARFLEQRLVQLLDRLAWVDGFEADADDTTESADLAAALRCVLAADARHDLEWRGGGSCRLPVSQQQARTLARSVRALLLELPAGPVELRSGAGEVIAAHPQSASAGAAFAGEVLASLLRRARVRFERRNDGFRIASEGTDDNAAA